MKKNIIYSIVAALFGLIIGYVLPKSDPTHQHDQSQSDNHQGQMWTCSMHPQIMQSEPGECPLCGMDLTPVENHGGDSIAADAFHMTDNAVALANIQTTVVGNYEGASSDVVLSGKIQTNEKQTYTQPAHYDARIEKLYVKTPGEIVQKGQAIAQVYSPELINAQQELLTAYKMKNQQPELYNAVKNKFKNWLISDREISNIIETGEVKRRFTIHSHISGVVTEINVKEGSHVIDGNAIFTTANLDRVWAVLDAYEKQIPILEKGQSISLVTNAYPDLEIPATIDYIDPIMDTQTRTVEVRAVLNNKDHKLKPGMFIKARVKSNVHTPKDSIIDIPASAVMWTGKRSVIYVKLPGEQPTFEMREIGVGYKTDQSIQVISGLQKGEEIVTQGTFTVDAAAQLQGKASMMH